MSYRICYKGKRPGKNSREGHAFGLIGVVVVFAVWLLAFGWFLPNQARRFREIFFPWSSAEVRDAVTELRDDVRSGIPFPEAAQAFCWELIQEGDHGD